MYVLSKEIWLILMSNWWVVVYSFFHPIKMSSAWRHKFYWFSLNSTAFSALSDLKLLIFKPGFELDILLLGWGQIDAHCWPNKVGWQKLNHLTSHLNNVETCVINMITQNLYFGFGQIFQPNKCVRDDFHQNWPITNEQLESQLNSRSCKHGGPLLEVAVGLTCQWIQAHRRSGMSKN